MNLERWACEWRDMVPHTATLTRLASECSVILELGTRSGVSTWALLDGLPETGTLHSIDSERATIDMVPDRVRDDPRWTLLWADDRSPELAIPSRVDMVFIDTSHEYDHTIAELDLARKLGASIIVLHDYALPDVADATHGFVRRYGGELTVEESEWGLAVIRR